MQFFNTIADWLYIIKDWNWSNSIVAFSTTVLAILTWLLWRETAKTRHNNQSAEIVVNFDIHPRYTNAINLVVENVGSGLAKNLNLRLEGNIEIGLKSERALILNEWNLFKKTIPYLKSKQQIKSFAFMYHDLSNPEKVNFEVIAEWDSYSSKKEKRLIKLDASVYEHIIYLGHDALHEIANAQKEISKNIKSVVSRNMIKVETVTQSERKEQEEEQRKQRQKFIEEMKAKNSNN